MAGTAWHMPSVQEELEWPEHGYGPTRYELSSGPPEQRRPSRQREHAKQLLRQNQSGRWCVWSPALTPSGVAWVTSARGIWPALSVWREWRTQSIHCRALPCPIRPLWNLAICQLECCTREGVKGRATELLQAVGGLSPVDLVTLKNRNTPWSADILLCALFLKREGESMHCFHETFIMYKILGLHKLRWYRRDYM